jgi:predicted RNA binding protein YcfA (HicA-like mRNA interferase family)
MLRSKSLIDFLSNRGYKYKDEDRRHKIYAHPQTRHRAVIPQRDLVDEQTAGNILRQAGESVETVKKFLNDAKT